MIHFVMALPATLEPNSIYYVQRDATTAEHYVTDSSRRAVEISTEVLVQAYMSTLKGAADGYAELDSQGKVPEAQLPSGASPTEISAAIAALDTSLQASIALKANAQDVYTQAQVDAIESSLQSAVNQKQDSLSNAADLAKVGNGAFDGDPFVLLGQTQW
jgi:hypothetical protein